MANLYKIRMSGRACNVDVGSTLSPGVTGNLVAISWPGIVGTNRYSTGTLITFSINSETSNRYFFRIALGDKTTGKRYFPSVAIMNTSGDSTQTRAMVPLAGDRIKMNWAASSHASVDHLDMDLLIDGPPGLLGTTSL